LESDNQNSQNTNSRASAERQSDCDFVVKRVINAPPSAVFEAWTTAELFQQWWVPKSVGLDLLSCELDVHVGGTYCLTFRHPAFDEPLSFHGRYLEVIPSARLAWTNDEAGGAGQTTTVTFEAEGTGTRVVLRDVYPSMESLDEAINSGSACDMTETFDQLDALLAGLRQPS